MANATFVRCHDGTTIDEEAMIVRATPGGVVPRAPTVSDLTVAPVAMELCCSICSEVLNEPKTIIPCGHTFCSNCIEPRVATTGSCPTCQLPVSSNSFYQCFPVKKLIANLRVRCIHGVSFDIAQGKFVPAADRGGCQLVMPLSEHIGHEKQCPFAPAQCKYAKDGCPFVKKRDAVAEHEAMCTFQKSDCKCGVQLQSRHMTSHQLACPAVEVDCPYKRFGCQEALLRAESSIHTNSCQYGVIANILKHQEEEHRSLLVRLAAFEVQNAEVLKANETLKSHLQEALKFKKRAEEELVAHRKVAADYKQKLSASQEFIKKQSRELDSLQNRLTQVESWLAKCGIFNDQQLHQFAAAGSRLLEPGVQGYLHMCRQGDSDSEQEANKEGGSGRDMHLAEPNGSSKKVEANGMKDSVQQQQLQMVRTGTGTDAGLHSRRMAMDNGGFTRVEPLEKLGSLEPFQFSVLDETKDGEVLSGSPSPTNPRRKKDGEELSINRHHERELIWRQTSNDVSAAGTGVTVLVSGSKSSPVAKQEYTEDLLGSALQPSDRQGDDDRMDGVDADKHNYRQDPGGFGVMTKEKTGASLNGECHTGQECSGAFQHHKAYELELLSKMSAEKGGPELGLGLMTLCGALESVEEGKAWHLRERKPRMMGRSSSQSSDKDDEDSYSEDMDTQSRRISKRRLEKAYSGERAVKRRTSLNSDASRHWGGRKNPIYASTEELKEDERCIRGDGKTWRCGKRRMYDKFCETHFQQQKMKVDMITTTTTTTPGLVTCRRPRKTMSEAVKGLVRRRLDLNSGSGQHQHDRRDGTREEKGHGSGEQSSQGAFPVYRGGKKNPLYAGKEHLKDEERCIRGDGRDWRCGRRRMPGEKFCETHFNQQKLKAERKHAKRGAALSAKKPPNLRASDDEGCSREWHETL